MTALPVLFSLEPRYKEQFAQFLVQGFTAFTAAMRIWPQDAGLAAQAAHSWPDDPYVKACIENAQDAAEKAKKPATKDVQVKRIEAKLSSMANDDYLKAERLIAEMLGHIEKAAPPSVTVNQSQNVGERVLVVTDHGSDEQWEAKMAAQQARLIEHNG